jgi:maleylpyruvate isomerase
VDSNPGKLQERIEAATGGLVATAAELTDEQAREPSLLPGWSRGHVLTHIARNADGLRNLLVWARTGVETPMYPHQGAREAGIEAGSARPAATLAADLTESAAAFADAAASLPASAWETPVHGRDGIDHPAWFTLFRRLSEVEIHHVDLGTGYTPPDWPEPFVADGLERVAGQFAVREDVPACVIEVTDGGQRFLLGPDSPGRAQSAVTVSGPGCWVLAWLTGRDNGTALSARSGQEPAVGREAALPKLPTWT